MTVSDHGYLGYAVITNKKFWDGLPADVREQLEQALKEATDYANKIAQEENDAALEQVKKSGKSQVVVLTPQERLDLKKAMFKVHKEMESRIGKEVIDARSTRKPASIRTSSSPDVPGPPGDPSGGPVSARSCQEFAMLKVLYHLEEWLISFLMGAATLIIFAAVMHRYASGVPIPGVQDWVLGLNFSWAQELCIIMFVWMAKFGAAYGVHTGIHVGVDVLINRLNERTRASSSSSACSPAPRSPPSSARRSDLRLGERRASGDLQAARPRHRRPSKARRRPTSKCRPGWSTRRFRSART